MQITFPDTKAKSWAERPIRSTSPTTSALAQPIGVTPSPELVQLSTSPQPSSDPEFDFVPEFALLATGGPHPAALLLSVCSLCALLALSIILVRVQRVNRVPREVSLTQLIAPPEPLAVADTPPPQQSLENTPPMTQTAQPATPDSPRTKPVKSEPLRPEPLVANPPTADAFTGQPVPRELMESPPPLVPSEAPKAAVITAPPVTEAAKEIEAAKQVPKPLTKTETVARPATAGTLPAAEVSKSNPAALPLTAVSTPTTPALSRASNPTPATLGALPLAQLLNHEAGLAASLASLPSLTRAGLPRVAIRVNTEWFEALAQTQERLYFSFTTPQADTEVLAYSPATHSFILETPMRPLWQIRDSGQVPALAALRAMAARRLGVPAESVALYTWHPPVLENALSMFVLERMQQLRVQLGPRDMVTVRLASGAGGAVMNLEPIREGGSR
jgi:hypothetical protein